MSKSKKKMEFAEIPVIQLALVERKLFGAITRLERMGAVMKTGEPGYYKLTEEGTRRAAKLLSSQR